MSTHISIKPTFLQVLEGTITWLENWEKEIRDELKPLITARDKEVADTETAIRERIKKKTIDDPKDVQLVKDIKAKHKLFIDLVERNFLSRTTAEGLRLTLRSTIDLSNELLTVDLFEYVLTRKMNQDCLEVL